MHVWFDCNPQVQILARALSSPVALLLALSAMMGKRERELLLSKQAVSYDVSLEGAVSSSTIAASEGEGRASYAATPADLMLQ